ncbi:linear amide C-N hydrolase [Desulfoluna sp.]|uniref:linear amide C-N hydrolase n=1 Tax=Desulfoluna sp. TaxID=2045199 RepID=UPI002622D5AF|nr:linear amide C-N hydrolase [Desulfoluna sp.]
MASKTPKTFFRHFRMLIFTPLILLSIGTAQTWACSEIWIDTPNTQVSARTFDFMFGDGFIRYTPRGTSQQAQYTPAEAAPLKWTSRYAALTFNTRFPCPSKGTFYAGVDGLNEAGLKIGTYYLPNSQFPKDGPRTTLDIASLQQYFLDRFKTVDEALSDVNSGRYRVTNTPSREFNIMLHLYLHDSTGHSAILEFMDGALKITDHPCLPVLTNTDYENATELIKHYSGFGGTAPIPGTQESNDRFVRAAYYRQHLEPPQSETEAIHYGLSLIKSVSIPPRFIHGCTQWTLITDIQTRKIYFQTLDSPDLAIIDFKKLAAAATRSYETDIMKTQFTGDITHLLIKN